MTALGGPGAAATSVALPARQNPFASHRIHALRWRPEAGFGGPSLADLLERWQGLGRRGALVGDEGRGKTTLLEALGAEWRRDRPRARLRRLTARPERGGRPERRAWALFLDGVGFRDLLLVDGLDHLRPWDRWRLDRAARRAAGLLATSHREGVAPTLLRCESTPALLAELVGELLGGEPPPVPLPGADELHRRHGGNLREALHELYDRCAGRWPGDVAPRAAAG